MSLRDRLERRFDEWRKARGYPEPPGGYHPVYDDDGNVIPSPPPETPTDVPADEVERARAAEGGG